MLVVLTCRAQRRADAESGACVEGIMEDDRYAWVAQRWWYTMSINGHRPFLQVIVA